MALPTGRTLLDPIQLLRRAGLRADMSYVDLGAGTLGHFVFPAADLVGEEGKVFALDILKSVIESIESRAAHSAVHQVQVLWGDIERLNGIGINDHSIDFVSLVGMGKLLLKKNDLVSEIKRILKLGGKLLIIDWKPGAGDIVVPENKRLRVEQIESRFSKAGFISIDQFDAGPQHWGLLLELS